MPRWPAALGFVPPSLLQAVLPARCPACGDPAVALCVACSSWLVPAPGAGPPAGVDWWSSPYAYDGPVRELIVAAKYRRARSGLAWLSHQMAMAVRGGGPAGVPAFDVVTWVPASPLRRRQRGFDQARILAGHVAADLGLPARRLLHRRPGPAQTGSTRTQRHHGPELIAVAALTGRCVLVVDDVATTGASLGRAASALRGAGAVRIGALTGARTARTASTGPFGPPVDQGALKPRGRPADIRDSGVSGD